MLFHPVNGLGPVQATEIAPVIATYWTLQPSSRRCTAGRRRGPRGPLWLPAPAMRWRRPPPGVQSPNPLTRHRWTTPASASTVVRPWRSSFSSLPSSAAAAATSSAAKERCELTRPPGDNQGSGRGSGGTGIERGVRRHGLNNPGVQADVDSVPRGVEKNGAVGGTQGLAAVFFAPAQDRDAGQMGVPGWSLLSPAL